jgi:hypothetical protein
MLGIFVNLEIEEQVLIKFRERFHGVNNYDELIIAILFIHGLKVRFENNLTIPFEVCFNAEYKKAFAKFVVSHPIDENQ